MRDGRSEPAGELALQNGSDARLPTFTQMMVTDHTTLDAQGTVPAAQLDIAPGAPRPQLSEIQAMEMQQLNTAVAGGSFDRACIDQQITAHERM